MAVERIGPAREFFQTNELARLYDADKRVCVSMIASH
ncbi:hypothetical protein B398_00460 [Xylella fastidiosa 32]|nr:hypothetical protein B398_00460 [Xylella fastidiosa 32]